MGKFRALFRDFDRVPVSNINLSLNDHRKSFHTQDKEIRRHRITLPDTFRGLNTSSFPAIHKDLNATRADTGHNKVDKIVGEVEEEKGVSDKGPFQSVKSLFKINFDNHAGVLAFHFCKVGKCFLHNDSIVRGSSIGQKLV